MDIRTFTGRALSRAALPLALLPLVGPLPVAAQSSTVDFPRQGVVCDLTNKRCFNSEGVSVPLTREFFGSYGERELVPTLSGNRGPTKFALSDGKACDVRRQTCWDDGQGGKNVSRSLSTQLFGNRGAWGNNGSGSSGWGNNNNNNWQQPEQATSSCELRQGNRRLFEGNCLLNRRESANGMAYNVELADGQRYSFYNRQGRLVLQDSSGLWPVQISNRNGDVNFRWADRQLVTRDRRWANQGPQGGSSDFNPTGNFLQDLFNTMFR
ncbi:hypothetical protein KBY93_02320 [Synechococcus sp. J7-Johnson]|uniref:YcgJ family protein n=1 Tax=Synechococcus sp. J7-Johnson TaxID=2823737 RepID=UPI0020CEAAED|nr:YcgJ family protein [Synechococcus sp. J7-Johnson]MCP9839468.1 hypothetical protein [Synechococcus sp. J7-Johnson]